jgi:hypothetical protein
MMFKKGDFVRIDRKPYKQVFTQTMRSHIGQTLQIIEVRRHEGDEYKLSDGFVYLEEALVPAGTPSRGYRRIVL